MLENPNHNLLFCLKIRITDANIKTYSRANLIDKNIKLMDTFRKNARELETTYSRVSTTRTPTLGSVND